MAGRDGSGRQQGQQRHAHGSGGSNQWQLRPEIDGSSSGIAPVTRARSVAAVVRSLKFLSCNEALKLSMPQEKKDEASFMPFLRIVESTPGLYHSYEMDLTLNLQRACKLVEGRLQKPLWKQTVQFTVKDLLVNLSLISRRCNRRLETRMWRRGAHLEGATANFIETEQLVEYESFSYSFLQESEGACVIFIEGQPIPLIVVKMGCKTCPTTSHVGFGLLLGSGGKRFRTQGSEVVRLADLLDEAKDLLKMNSENVLKVNCQSGRKKSLNKLHRQLAMLLSSILI